MLHSDGFLRLTDFGICKLLVESNLYIIYLYLICITLSKKKNKPIQSVGLGYIFLLRFWKGRVMIVPLTILIWDKFLMKYWQGIKSTISFLRYKEWKRLKNKQSWSSRNTVQKKWRILYLDLLSIMYFFKM